MVAALVSCETLTTRSSTEPEGDSTGALTDRDRELLRAELVPQPLPASPDYARAHLDCFFYAQHPEDLSMVPVGILKQGAYVIVRHEDGEWVDIQLTSGQLGSVLASNLRAITAQENRSQDYLEPQPDLGPISKPQANATVIDTTLLGG